MPEAVLVSALRTPIGTGGRGTLRDTTAFGLADHVVSAAKEGLGVIARHAAVTAGLTTVPGLALNRHCAAGLASVQQAAASVKAGRPPAP